ncbi:MAG TPA: hypothetical protein VGW34_07255 [Allosphingosinicella sp.]|nr:hypothetical protein [Allosphingosinicella sp.]
MIQRGFAAIGRHAAAFAGLALLLGGVPTFLTSYLLDSLAAGGPFTAAPGYGLSVLVAAVCGSLLQAALVRVVVLDLSGREPDIVAILIDSLKMILPMIGLAILSWILTILGLILLVVPGIIIYLMLIVAVPALVEERGGVIHSMRRSRELTKGSRGRIFLLLLLFGAAYFGSWLCLSFVIGLVGIDAATATLITDSLLGSVAALLTAAMLASLYVELRTVKEGATAEGLAAIFD